VHITHAAKITSYQLLLLQSPVAVVCRFTKMPGFMTGTASDSPKMRIAKTITKGFETIGLNAASTTIKKELTIIAIQHQKLIKALCIPFIFLIPASYLE